MPNFNITNIIAGSGYGQVICMNPQDAKQTKTTYGDIHRQQVVDVQVDKNSIAYATPYRIQIVHREDSSRDEVARLSPEKNNTFIKLILGEASTPEIIFATSNGSLSLWSESKVYMLKNGEKEFSAGNKFYRRMNSLFPYYAFAGKELPPMIFQGEKEVVKWTAKNVPNDFLGLRAPINDVDLYLHFNLVNLTVLTASSSIRIYDIRGAKRRPSLQGVIANVEPQSFMKRMAVSFCENYYYCGNDLGGIYECDIRKDFAVCGKFKGATTTITGISLNDERLIASSVDGYIRMYDKQTRKLEEKFYFNKPISAFCLEHGESVELPIYKEEICYDEEEEIVKKAPTKMKEIRKRNKVGLKYLKPREFDDIKIEEVPEPEVDWVDHINPIDRRDF